MLFITTHEITVHEWPVNQQLTSCVTIQTSFFSMSFVPVSIWFLFYRYILILLCIYILNQAFLNMKNVAPSEKSCQSYDIKPLPPHNRHLFFTATFLCPQGGHCREVWILKSLLSTWNLSLIDVVA